MAGRRVSVLSPDKPVDQPVVTDANEKPVKPWTRWLVLAQVLGIFAFLAFAIVPRSNDTTLAGGTASSLPSGSLPAGSLPVTRDSSIRAAQDIATGTAAEFDTLMTELTTLDSTIRVDLKYRGRDNFTGTPLPGYEGNRAYLRREAARALATVQTALRAEGLGLLVYDSYRPFRATQAMVAWTVREKKEQLVTDGYISDRSRHNLGVAIDCTLVELATGRPLDMGVPFDTFSSAAHTVNATGVAAVNRTRFVAAMRQAGFANYDQEWWHFSYDVPATTLRRFDIEIR